MNIEIEKSNAEFLKRKAMRDLVEWKITATEYIKTINKIRIIIDSLLK